MLNIQKWWESLKLSPRIAVYLLAANIALLGSYAYFGSQKLSLEAEHEYTEHQLEKLKLIAPLLYQGLWNYSESTLKTITTSFGFDKAVVGVWIKNEFKENIYISPESITKNHFISNLVSESVSSLPFHKDGIFLRNSKYLGISWNIHTKHFNSDPENRYLGSIIVLVSLEEIFSEVRSEQKNFILICIALALTNLLIVFLFLRRNVLKPISLLASSTASQQLNTTEFKLPPPPSGKDEISKLHQTLYDAYEGLSSSVKKETVLNVTQMLAHDLRKPFSMIKMLLGLLKNNSSPEDIKKTLEYLPSVENSAQYASNVIDDLLTIGKPLNVNYEMNSIRDIVAETLSDFATDRTVKISLQHGALMLFDRAKIQRVICNLIQNAFDATQPGELIWIQSHRKSHEIIFCIGNQGKTIEKNRINTMFEPFYTNDKREGTGLGLAICRRMIEAHGGSISCHSNLSAGTEFTFSIKNDSFEINDNEIFESEDFQNRRGESLEMALSSKTSQKPDFKVFARFLKERSNPLSLAIVDDNKIFLDSFKQLLENTPGCSHLINAKFFRCSQDFESSFDIEFDIAFIDVDLGEVNTNGLDLSRKLKERNDNVMVFILSDRIQLRDQDFVSQYGASGFIEKPISLLKLSEAFKKFLTAKGNNEHV